MGDGRSEPIAGVMGNSDDHVTTTSVQAMNGVSRITADLGDDSVRNGDRSLLEKMILDSGLMVNDAVGH